ncbi:MAG: two-component sensor histidine kinase [Hydrogenophaga sp.]|nr:two-component sensor histidine kinase [Hydrogenophaga sp.]
MSQFRLAFSKAGSLVSLVLVMFGVGLDYTLYPQHFTTLLGARVLTSLATLIVYGVLWTSYGLRYVRFLTLLWLALPQIMIAWMIWYTEGVDSIYFVGLHLALYATGIILPISFLENVGFGLFTYVLYAMACYGHAEGLQDFNRFAGVSLFILFSGTVSSFCTYFNERGRFNMFRLQHEVSQKNAELSRTNQALADIKGQMVQQEKMAALGTLSAGLLHELNNPVNFSLMAIDMGRQLPAVKQDELLSESLGDAREGLVRIQNIVTDLKTFAYQKPDGGNARPFLFENAARSAVRLAGFDLKGVDVTLDMPHDTHVMGDEPALIGVMINLLSNAAHAVRAAQREHPEVAVRAVIEGDRMAITVRDNGQGIPAGNLERVFEPFFTTRDVGSGLGLGLSISYGIVQRHGGTLAVRSEPGAWTEFHFHLPRPA